jgi:hypothetical protein
MTKKDLKHRALIRSEIAVHERLLELRDQLIALTDAIDRMTLSRRRKKRAGPVYASSSVEVGNLVSFARHSRERRSTPR